MSPELFLLGVESGRLPLGGSTGGPGRTAEEAVGLLAETGQVHKQRHTGIPGSGEAAQANKLGGETQSGREGQEIHFEEVTSEHTFQE